MDEEIGYLWSKPADEWAITNKHNVTINWSKQNMSSLKIIQDNIVIGQNGKKDLKNILAILSIIET